MASRRSTHVIRQVREPYSRPIGQLETDEEMLGVPDGRTRGMGLAELGEVRLAINNLSEVYNHALRNYSSSRLPTLSVHDMRQMLLGVRRLKRVWRSLEYSIVEQRRNVPDWDRDDIVGP